MSSGGQECQDVDIAVAGRLKREMGGGVALRTEGMAP